MKRLKDYAYLKLNEIRVEYGDEKITFNLMKELKINEAMIEKELKEQPSLYAFLFMLHKKLLTRFEELKVEKNKVWGHLFLKAKEEQSHGGRPFNDEMCKAWVETQPKYIRAQRACIEAKDQADLIFSAVKGFEQRKDNLQTLSANNRKQV